jgi:hypothetical protein
MNAAYDQIYAEAIKNGASETFADMLASRQPPGGMTDNVAVAGIGKLGDQFKGKRGEIQLNKIIASAKRHGYTPNPNDIYQPGLAQFAGDPKAFIPSGAGYRSHIKKICEANDLACEGTVNVKRRQYRDAPKQIPLAEKLIRELTPKVLAKDPALARKKPQEIREAVIAKHGSK